MSFKTEILYHEDNVFKILRRIKELDNPSIDIWKEHLMADRIFRDDGQLLFCRLIPEAIIENISE